MLHKIRIKNMVCSRCQRVVTEELRALGFQVIDVRLGEAIIDHEEEPDQAVIRHALQRSGFDLVEDRANALVESVKGALIQLIQSGNLSEMPYKISEYLEQQTGKDYRYLSTLFSQTVGMTIEKYVIAQKIERVKELLVYDEMSLSDIAFELGYSSVSYLSNQFKNETQVPPSVFKKQALQARKGLDTIGS
jgi:AraC family transcriptional regulator